MSPMEALFKVLKLYDNIRMHKQIIIPTSEEAGDIYRALEPLLKKFQEHLNNKLKLK